VRLEDYNRYTAEGWGGPFLVGTWKELGRLVEAVPSPSNGVTLCTGMDIPGGDVPSLVRAFAGKIHFCQFRDHSERWPGGRVASHGEGRVDFLSVVAALRGAGYRGMIHLEGFGKPVRPGEDVEARSIAYVRSLLGTG
jgi:D-mannonate dehydratase